MLSSSAERRKLKLQKLKEHNQKKKKEDKRNLYKELRKKAKRQSVIAQSSLSLVSRLKKASPATSNNSDQKDDQKQTQKNKTQHKKDKTSYMFMQQSVTTQMRSISMNAHQKKKYNKLLKESNEIEFKFTNKYLLETYGSKLNDDYTTELKDIDIDFGDVIIDIAIQMLLILHESWNQRMQIISIVVDQLCDASITHDVYALKLCKFLNPICIQFTDSRSLVIKQMKIHITRLIMSTAERFSFFAPFIIKCIAKTWPVRIEALRENGIELSQTIIQQCCRFDQEKALMYTMFDLIETNKHAAVRSKAGEYLHFMIQKLSPLETIGQTDKEENILQYLIQIIQIIINDASADTRINGYKILFVFHKIAPISARNIIQTMSNAQIKKFYKANGMKQHNIVSTDNDQDEKYPAPSAQATNKSISEYDFNLSFKQIRSQPKDLEKRIKEIFVNKDTIIKNKNDKQVFFQDLVRLYRIGIHNRVPLLLLLNDSFVRCKINSNNNNAFDIEYFIKKYNLDKLTSTKWSDIFISAIKQFQFVYPCLSVDNSDEYDIVADTLQIFINYTIGFLRFIETHKNDTNGVNQFDLIIIPQHNANDNISDINHKNKYKKTNKKQKKAVNLKRVLKKHGIDYVISELDALQEININDIYTKYCNCFDRLITTNADKHSTFIVDRRITNHGSTSLYGIVIKSTISKSYNSISQFPEFYIAKSKEVLFGNNLNKSRSKMKQKKKGKKKNVKILNGILFNICNFTKFGLFCHILENDCIRFYWMMNNYLTRFAPIDMWNIWPKFFNDEYDTMDSTDVSQFTDIPVLNDKQLEQFYFMLTKELPNWHNL